MKKELGFSFDLFSVFNRKIILLLPAVPVNDNPITD